LDPAQPAFDFATKNDRLDKEDADFVDVIHTNSGMIWEVQLLKHDLFFFIVQYLDTSCS